MEKEEKDYKRYLRQMQLSEIGLEGQDKLKKSSVLIIGAGGLGSPVAMYLAAAGVGTIGLVDFDKVEISNLHRQILHTTSNLGMLKLDSAKQTLLDINPNIDIRLYHESLNASNAIKIIENYDLVIDGTDNFPTRYLVNDTCILLGKPNVYGSILRFDGQATVFMPGKGPCYRCLFPNMPEKGTVPNCAEAGVLGVLPGVIGSIQATEVIKVLLGIGEPLIGRLLTYDALSLSFDEIGIERNKECMLCGDKPTIISLIDYTNWCQLSQPQGNVSELSVFDFSKKLKAGEEFFILDVREDYELAICALQGVVNIPLNKLKQSVDSIPKDKIIVVVCHMGVRSLMAISVLQENGFNKLLNLTGGIDEYASKIDQAMYRY